MASGGYQVECAVEGGVCRCSAGVWEWRFQAVCPEEGFSLWPSQVTCGEPSLPTHWWANLFQIHQSDSDRSVWAVEDVFTVGSTRCVVRYRDPSQGKLELSLVATLSNEPLNNAPSVPGEVHQLHVVLLARTERPFVQPAIKIVNEIHATRQTALGTIEISQGELKASTFPIALGQRGGHVLLDTLRFSFDAFQLSTGHWLVACVHPLDGVEEPQTPSPSTTDRCRGEELGGDLQPPPGRYAFGYHVFPEGIEKGVTFATRGLGIIFPEQTPRATVLGRLREFLISERPISEV